MMPAPTKIINQFWLLLQKREQTRSWKEAGQLQRVQNRMLLEIVRQNRHTVFGRAHGFDRIGSYEDFASRVPVLDDWDALNPYIERIAAGESGILTQEKVVRFEETSGTSGFSKLIPYTPTLKKAFGRAIAVWMTELANVCPEAFSGKAYWSVSPALKPVRRSPGGIPIGMEDDTGYFNPFTALLLKQIMVRPEVQNETDAARFYLKTLEALSRTPRLSFISVWSPTFFLQLDQYLCENRAVSGIPDAFVWSDLFPQLSCLSCWTGAQASLWIERVQQRLGPVPVQGKGLLATEGVTTIPIGLSGHTVLAYRSHFFEFRETASGQICPAAALREGAEYEVLLSNGSGLYRYATRDLVRCTGWYRSVPMLVFQGRQQALSDMVGEKLSEQQATAAIVHSGFSKNYGEAMLVAALLPHKGQACYHLMLFNKLYPDFDDESALQRLEAELSRNPYFRQARDARQLAPVKILRPGKSPVRQMKDYLQQTRRIKEGDIKVPVLVRAGSGPNWV